MIIRGDKLRSFLDSVDDLVFIDGRYSISRLLLLDSNLYTTSRSINTGKGDSVGYVILFLKGKEFEIPENKIDSVRETALSLGVQKLVDVIDYNRKEKEDNIEDLFDQGSYERIANLITSRTREIIDVAIKKRMVSSIINVAPGLQFTRDDVIATIKNNDIKSFSSLSNWYPKDVLSECININSLNCYDVLKSSPKFRDYCCSIGKINVIGALTRKMVSDAIECNGVDPNNPNWVSLNDILGSNELQNALIRDSGAQMLFATHRRRRTTRQETAVLEATKQDTVVPKTKQDNILSIFRRNDYNSARALVGTNGVFLYNGVESKPLKSARFIVVNDSIKNIERAAFCGNRSLEAVAIPVQFHTLRGLLSLVAVILNLL